MKLPFCILGFVLGEVRWECPTVGELFWDRNKLFFLSPPKTFFLAIRGAQKFALTHLQKKSRFGFLVMKGYNIEGSNWFPFIFYGWFAFRKQKQIDNGWEPGTELGIFFRTPGLRFDFADNCYIKSRGYFGLHMD